jgi:hypothetical protein
MTDYNTAFTKGNTDATTAFAKFDSNTWKRVEQKIDSPFEISVFKTLIELGSDTNDVNTNDNIDYQQLGDEIYSKIIRKDLQFLKDIEEPTETNKKKKKPMAKIDKMKMENTMKKVTERWAAIHATFIMEDFNSRYSFRSVYGETRLAGLMFLIKYTISGKSICDKNKYELIIGVMKTLANLENDDRISKLALHDLRELNHELKQNVGFTYETLFTVYPKFILTTRYDKVFPKISITPYKSQMEIVDLVKNNDQGLFLYIAMIGSGKTSTSLALAEYVKHLQILANAQNTGPTNNKNIKSKGKYRGHGKVQLAEKKKAAYDSTVIKEKQNKPNQLLFVCSVEPVRLQVCRIAFSNEVSFGISVVENGVTRVINNYNCAKGTEPVLIVADIDSAIELLKLDQNYILFLDEPTVGADVPDHPITSAVAKLMEVAPAKTILCSATLPFKEEIPEIINNFQERYSEAMVHTVHSMESIIGCEIKSFDGMNITPHNNCKNKTELMHVIRQLNTKPFVGKMYTGPILYMIWNRMNDAHIIHGVDLETYFSNFNNMCQNKVQEMAKILLQKLADTDDDTLIQKMCEPLGNIKINEGDEKVKKVDESDDESVAFAFDNSSDSSDSSESSVDETGDEYKYDAMSIDNIFTTDAHKFMGACMVVVNDPVKFAYDNSVEFRKDLKPASRIIANLEKNEATVKNEIKKLEHIKDDMKRTQKQQELQKPAAEFPNEYRVNTQFHLQKYVSKSKHKKINKQLAQTMISIENLPRDLDCPDWAMLLLYSGIGIYHQGNHMFGQNYTDLVLQMASLGQLAFLITNISISYGSNYPFCHLIVKDEVLINSSINTAFQLFGRVGRVGKSWVGFIHVGNMTSERLMNYIQGKVDSGTSEEAINMNRAMNRLKHDRDESIRLEQELIEEKIVVTQKKKSTVVIVSNGGSAGKMVKLKELETVKPMAETVTKPLDKPDIKPMVGPNKYRPQIDSSLRQNDRQPDNRSYRPNDRQPDNRSYRPNDRQPDNRSYRPNDRPSDNRSYRANDRPSDNRSYRANDRPSDNRSYRPNDRQPDNRSYRANDRQPDNRSYRPNDRPSDNRSYRPNDRPSDNRSYRPNDRPSEDRPYRANDRSNTKPSSPPDKLVENKTTNKFDMLQTIE